MVTPDLEKVKETLKIFEGLVNVFITTKDGVTDPLYLKEIIQEALAELELEEKSPEPEMQRCSGFSWNKNRSHRPKMKGA